MQPTRIDELLRKAVSRQSITMPTQQGFAMHRQKRFGAGIGQRAHTGATPRSQYHGLGGKGWMAHRVLNSRGCHSAHDARLQQIPNGRQGGQIHKGVVPQVVIVITNAMKIAAARMRQAKLLRQIGVTGQLIQGVAARHHLDRLAASKVLRTDEQGRIEVVSDGENLWVMTERQP